MLPASHADGTCLFITHSTPASRTRPCPASCFNGMTVYAQSQCAYQTMYKGPLTLQHEEPSAPARVGRENRARGSRKLLPVDAADLGGAFPRALHPRVFMRRKCRLFG